MHRIIFFIIILVFLPFKVCAQEYNKVHILHINDANGNINPIQIDNKIKAGGILKLADFVRSFRKKNDNNTIFISSADIIAPMPDSSKNNGKIYIDFFNKVKLDIWSPGDYDFLYGLDALKKRVSEANFQVVNTNLFYKNSKENIFKPYTIIEKCNYKFLFLGVTNLSSYEQLPDDVRLNVEIKDPLEAINNTLENLNEDYDFVVLIAQLSNEDKASILKKTKVDLIVGSIGKISESDLITFSTFNNKYSVITPGYTTSVGQVDLIYDKEKNNINVVNLKNNLLIAEKYNEDISDIQEIINKYYDESDKEPLASFITAPTRIQSYEFINYSIHEICNCEITIFPNDFFMRGYYFSKEINKYDIFSIIPVPSKVNKIKLNGIDLKNFIKNLEIGNYTISGYKDGKVNNVTISNSENYILCTNEQTYRKNKILKEQRDVYTTSENINQLLYKYIINSKNKVFDINKEKNFDNWKFIFKLDLDPQFLNVNLKDGTDYNYLVWKGDKNAISWGGVSNFFLRKYWDTNEFDNRLTIEFRQQQTANTSIEKFADSIQLNSIFRKRFFNNIIVPFTETKISSFFINPKPDKPHQVLFELNTGLLHDLIFGFKIREGLEIRKNLLDQTLPWQFGGFFSLNFTNNISFLKEEFEGKLYLPVDGKTLITEIQNRITYPVSNLFNLYYQINLYNETFDYTKMAIRQNAGISLRLDNPFTF
jgi:2',3'-cyclic-nucleotide 2'-phosphodiesterase (5'-nucleotidase family)